MAKQKSGFPDPLFENVDQLHQIAGDYEEGTLEYLIFLAPIGALRSADPILGDLTVMAREAVERVNARLSEIEAEGKTGEPGKVTGAVPLEQA